MYVHIYIYISIYIYIYMYIYAHMFAYTHKLCTSSNTRRTDRKKPMRVCVMFTHTDVCVCVYEFVCACELYAGECVCRCVYV